MRVAAMCNMAAIVPDDDKPVLWLWNTKAVAKGDELYWYYGDAYHTQLMNNRENMALAVTKPVG